MEFIFEKKTNQSEADETQSKQEEQSTLSSTNQNFHSFNLTFVFHRNWK